jgi:hypothetical protein
MASGLLQQERTLLAELHADLQRLGVERALEVVAGFKVSHFLIKGLGAGAERAVEVFRSIRVSHARLIENGGNYRWNQTSHLFRLVSVGGDCGLACHLV